MRRAHCHSGSEALGRRQGDPANRRVWRTALIAGALLAGSLLATACGRALPATNCGRGSLQNLSLTRLATDQDAYVGCMVRTIGRVVPFESASGTYYVIQDIDLNRVELLPASRAELFDGETVSVTGRFDFNGRIGRYLTIDMIAGAPQASGPQ
jgi:hypothetical protein